MASNKRVIVSHKTAQVAIADVAGEKVPSAPKSLSQS